LSLPPIRVLLPAATMMPPMVMFRAPRGLRRSCLRTRERGP
jgi:hypothetical protein